MTEDIARLGLWIPRELQLRMKALAQERSKRGAWVKLGTLYAEALGDLADALDGSGDLEFKVDRRDRVRVSLVVPAELRARMDGHCERLKVLGAEYAVAALTRYLDRELTDGARSQGPGARPPRDPA